MRLLTTLILLSLGLAAHAQGDRYVGLSGAYGVFLPHRVILPQLLQGPSTGMELYYTVATDGTEAWHHAFNQPSKGIGFFMLDMGNPTELGQVYSLYPFLEFPMIGKRKSKLIMRGGIGFAYLNRPYDPQDNFFALAIGSHVNYSIRAGLRYQQDTERLRYSLGLGLTHASNAAFRLPNLGVNVATIDLIIAYRVNKEPIPFMNLDEAITEQSTDNALLVIASFGARESNTVTREKHGVQELRLDYDHSFSPKLSYHLGGDIIHSRASYQDLEDGTQAQFGIDAMQAGVHAGLGLDLGRSELYVHQGVYLAQGYQELGALYHRFGGRHAFSSRWIADLSMKTHFARADYLALGMAYTLRAPISTVK